MMTKSYKNMFENIKDWIIILLLLTGIYCIYYNPIKDAVTSNPQIDTFTYKGHTMLRYSEKGNISICHSPECKKCIQIYD